MSQALKEQGGDDILSQASAKFDKLTRVITMAKAVKDGDAHKSSKQQTRSHSFDVSSDFESRMSFWTPFEACCKSLDLKPNWVRPTIEVTINIITAESVWKLLDENNAWQQAQSKAFASCVIRNLDSYAEQINKAGNELTASMARWAHLSAIVDAPLPEEVIEDLTEQIGVFESLCNRKVGAFVKQTSTEASQEIVDFIRKQKNTEKAVIKYRGAKSFIVFMDLGLISGHIAHAVASFGGTAALAIIAIVRNALDIAQIVTKAMLKLEQMEVYIDKEMALLAAAFDEGNKKSAKNNALESILGVVKGVLNLEVPSVDVCNTHIGDYEHKLRALIVSFNELGFEQGRVQKVMQNYAALLNAEGDKFEAKQKSALTGLINCAEEAYLDISGNLARKEKAIDAATRKAEAWRADLAKLEQATSKWTKYVSRAAGLITSAALGLGHIGAEHVEKAPEIAAKTAKLGGEAVVVVFEAVSSYLADKFAEADNV